VLLEEDLLQRRRYGDDALIRLGLPADVGLRLNEQHTELEVEIVPHQMFDLPFSHSGEQDRREQPPLIVAARGKNLRISSDVMNRGSDRFGMRNFSISLTGLTNR
jgi:hypothetical protein